MVINWYGEGCFRIQSGDVVILTDPFLSTTGLVAPRFKADMVLKTGMFPAYVSEKDNETRIIVGPGEYEVKGAEVRGFPAVAAEEEREVTGAVYVVKIEDMKLGILGGLAKPDLSPDAMEKLQGVEMLFVPVGGAPYLSAEEAAKLVKKIEPKMVIPCFFKTSGLKRQAKDVKDFEQEMSQKSDPQEKLTIKAKDITWEGTKLAVLKV